MINFKITNNFDGMITVIKPVGKPIPLSVGEIVKGDVMDILPAGGVTLKIKGSFITARTDMPMQKDTQVMLKVLGTSDSPNELRLQFLGEAGNLQESGSNKSEALGRFLQAFSGANAKSLSSDMIEGLLKTLPSDVNAMPKDLKLQLQVLLQDSLKATGQDMQTRLDSLLKDLQGLVKNDALLQGLKLSISVSVDKLLSDGMKGLLRDSGVALEAKLKAMSDMVNLATQEPSDEIEGSAAAVSKNVLQSAVGQAQTAAENKAIENDLKANLLRMREALTSNMQNVADRDMTATKSALSGTDAMLKDIETLQLLSKTTQSYFSFLPVSWQELRDGDISFKENQGGSSHNNSFSCKVNLDLKESGKMAVLVLSYNSQFYVSFRPESDKLKALLTEHIGRLDEQFKEKGLTLKAARVLEKDDKEIEQLENLDTNRQIINIKA
jgi:hypothetical protein